MRKNLLFFFFHCLFKNFSYKNYFNIYCSFLKLWIGVKDVKAANQGLKTKTFLKILAFKCLNIRYPLIQI